MISFFVPGIPAPQGSKRAFVVAGRARLVESSKACKPWRTDARAAALNAMHGAPPLEGPLAVDVVFVMPRPATMPKERKGWPATRPDRDKLLRAICDALTGIAYRDDSQICAGSTTKRYVGSEGAGHTPGALVEIERLDCEGHEPDGRGRCRHCGLPCGEVAR